jgi:universal stress protein E
MGAISRSGLKRLFIGNTAERILDDLTCDVLVVKPRGFVSKVSPASRGVRLLTPNMPLPY